MTLVQKFLSLWELVEIFNNTLFLSLYFLFPIREITLNHENITWKSSPLDYALSSHFWTRVTYDESYIRSCMAVNGIFDHYEKDVGTGLVKTHREQKGVLIHKVLEIDNEQYQVPFYRYYITKAINHGLARVPDVLPSNMTIGIRFQRADSKCALLKLSQTIDVVKMSDKSRQKIDFDYPESVIPLQNPMIHAFYAYSLDLERVMNRVKSSSLEIEYLDYVVRRTVLPTGLNFHQIDLGQGKCPKYIIFALSYLDRLAGSETESMTVFRQGDLVEFDLTRDHESLVEFPLSGTDKAAQSFYINYLKMTDR